MALWHASADPFAQMRELERMMDRTFSAALDRAFGTSGNTGLLSVVPSAGTKGAAWQTVGSSGAHKPMDVVEYDDRYEIVADAPGMTPEEIDVSVQEGVLTVKGQHREERVEHDRQGKLHRAERTYTSFSRSFCLPKNATEDNISASLNHGVLRVSVPKASEPDRPQPKRIEVRAAA